MQVSAPRNTGSDTCSFEVMKDQAADKLLARDADAFSTLGKVTFPMNNLGNTCFFNSVMQCLTHTLPFLKMCLSGQHEKQCTRSQGCYQCSYGSFFKELNQNKRANPGPIVKSLPAVWRTYRFGQQKDAHEFLTIYLEALLNSSFHEKPSRVHVIKN